MQESRNILVKECAEHATFLLLICHRRPTGSVGFASSLLKAFEGGHEAGALKSWVRWALFERRIGNIYATAATGGGGGGRASLGSFGVHDGGTGLLSC